MPVLIFPDAKDLIGHLNKNYYIQKYSKKPAISNGDVVFPALLTYFLIIPADRYFLIIPVQGSFGFSSNLLQLYAQLG